MDIEKAIEWQKAFKKTYNGMPQEVVYACDFTIAALEELQQYRQTGTVDECRAAIEKQIPMHHHHTRINKVSIETRDSVCPSCLGVTRSALDAFPKYCSNCGKALKWGD